MYISPTLSAGRSPVAAGQAHVSGDSAAALLGQGAHHNPAAPAAGAGALALAWDGIRCTYVFLPVWHPAF